MSKITSVENYKSVENSVMGIAIMVQVSSAELLPGKLTYYRETLITNIMLSKIFLLIN